MEMVVSDAAFSKDTLLSVNHFSSRYVVMELLTLVSSKAHATVIFTPPVNSSENLAFIKKRIRAPTNNIHPIVNQR